MGSAGRVCQRAPWQDVRHMKEEFLYFYGVFGFGGLIGALVLYAFIKIFIPSYLSQKGKNLATKEDIEEITRKVESVKSSYAKVLEEIRHENKLVAATIEREKLLRKEVYLDAVGAIVRTQNMIANFANLNLTNEHITSALAKDSGTISKVQIVGTSKTVKAVTHFMAEVGTVTMDLMLQRAALIAEQEDPNYKESNRSETYEVLDKLWLEHEKKKIEFVRKCMNRFFEISAFLPPAILSVREELEMDISEEDYLDIFNENIQKGRKVFDEFFRKIQGHA